MEVRDRDTKALGVNHVVVGECDHVIQDIYRDIEFNGAPEYIHVPRGPKLEDIPDIVSPTVHGLVEVMRGCGRNCQFCEPNLRIAKYYPRDKIEREIAVNRKIGNPNVWVHSEDIFLYKLEDKRGFMPNHDAVVDLFDNVMSQKGITYANPTHGTTAPAWADPELIRDISETVRKGTKRHIGIQSGLETGSSELIKRYMPLKVKPFSPDEWPDVIYNGTRIFNENYWFPAYTIIVGLPGETTEDAVETVRLIDRMEHGLHKEIGDMAHFTVTPLSFVPLGVLKKSGFYNIDDQIEEARFWVIYRCWRHTVLELHTMPPTLIQLNPALKAIFTTRARIESAMAFTAVDAIADSIRARGLRRVTGKLVGDGSYFDPVLVHPGWNAWDLNWWYAAPVSGLGFHDNSVDFHIAPGGAVDQPPSITWTPDLALFTFENRARTVPADSSSTVGDNFFRKP